MTFTREWSIIYFSWRILQRISKINFAVSDHVTETHIQLGFNLSRRDFEQYHDKASDVVHIHFRKTDACVNWSSCHPRVFLLTHIHWNHHIDAPERQYQTFASNITSLTFQSATSLLNSLCFLLLQRNWLALLLFRVNYSVSAFGSCLGGRSNQDKMKSAAAGNITPL
jgi:hypothetical protein